jgi:hypothetical protein
MRGTRDDDVSWRSDRGGSRTAPEVSPSLRTAGLVCGLLLAVAATAVVFLTDNPQHLRLAVIAAAWAFVLAAFAAGRRRAETLAAAEREETLRRRYEHELDREAAAHREHELELENQLRRETEESMRAELAALRRDIAGVSSLREDPAGIPAGISAGISALRDELAGLAALRADVASLAALRQDLDQLTELRADLGRLRGELAEQLNGEMLIERIMLRTQSFRAPTGAAPADGPRTVESAAVREDDRPPRGLTGGWPAVRLDELAETRQAERVHVDRPAVRSAPPAPPQEPAHPVATRFAPPVAPPPTPLEWLADRSLVEPADLEPSRSRHAAESGHVPAPHERSGAPAGDLLPAVPPRRRRTDEPFDDRTAERPVTPVTSSEPVVRPTPFPRPTLPPTRAVPVADEEDSAGHQRLTEILADNGVQPPSGGRRRRRYRDEDDPDDVLARVLGRS